MDGTVSSPSIASRLATRAASTCLDRLVGLERLAPGLAEVVDPTGAGDAFAAGFLAEWVRTNDPIASAMCGVLVGARAVETIGGRP